MNVLRKLLPVCLPATLLAGCVTTSPKVDVAEPTQARPSAAAYAPVNNGAIFQAGGYRPLYETHRARMVGDIITVTISEATSAKQETTSSIEKKGSVSSAITAVPLIRLDQVAKLGAAGSSDNKFDGTGSTAATGNFTGTITATVTEVLPNGHLIVAGEKQIGVAKNVDVLRFSGQVDPVSIQPGNTVLSSQIANVRIEHMGRGAQQDAQGIGWLAHFFLSISPF
ncbi:MAG: flagellar basal body L-ring protein FlgH [Aquabacterium sp.]|uniref:flagellar basal body L-ring protein FlgH n=1 Tax=Aquabacterium sp. TaxID=1872578 RepID=UPI0025C41558|nr:flagellar basal body L-ring protein FlgH [Aquabacterium sp.]MBI3380746.1 flagellar basal body L-ring protein FlgH [Aquabacterium sp.]